MGGVLCSGARVRASASSTVSTLGIDLDKGSLVKVFVIKGVVAEVSCVSQSRGGSAGEDNCAGALWVAGVLAGRGRRGIIGLHCVECRGLVKRQVALGAKSLKVAACFKSLRLKSLRLKSLRWTEKGGCV